MRNRTKYTISYSCVQASFWMSLCVFSGFAAVYLQSLDYTNASLGMILACGTLLGSLLGPELSSAIDRSTEDRITASSLMPKVIAAEALATVIMLLVPVKGIVTSVSFVAFIALATTINSLVLKLYSDAVYCGMDIDYGVSRSMGSLGYVLTSFAVGSLCEAISPRAVPAAGLAVCAFQLLSFLKFSGYLKGAQAGRDRKNSLIRLLLKEQKGSSSITAFLIRNKAFCLILLGSTLIFFSHNTLCNFFINVVKNVGGTTSDMGFLNGLMALIEIPVIFFYTKLTAISGHRGFSERDSSSSPLKLQLSPWRALLRGCSRALLLQAPSFRIYPRAIVPPYVDEVISHDSSTNAEALLSRSPCSDPSRVRVSKPPV